MKYPGMDNVRKTPKSLTQGTIIRQDILVPKGYMLTENNQILDKPQKPIGNHSTGRSKWGKMISMNVGFTQPIPSGMYVQRNIHRGIPMLAAPTCDMEEACQAPGLGNSTSASYSQHAAALECTRMHCSHFISTLQKAMSQGSQCRFLIPPGNLSILELFAVY